MANEDFIKIFREITNSIPIYTDLSIMLFVQYRNLYSGANTITRAGITSPNGGLLRNFPASICPDGVDLMVGAASYQSNTVVSAAENLLTTIQATVKTNIDNPGNLLSALRALLGI